jgi:hypothetical protein
MPHRPGGMVRLRRRHRYVTEARIIHSALHSLTSIRRDDEDLSQQAQQNLKIDHWVSVSIMYDIRQTRGSMVLRPESMGYRAKIILNKYTLLDDAMELEDLESDGTTSSGHVG